MSKVEYEGRLDYSKFDKMDTDILEALLRANFDAPEAEQMEPEAALYILNLLSERQEDETSPTATDIAAKKLKSLGVSVYDAQGKMRNLMKNIILCLKTSNFCKSSSMIWNMWRIAKIMLS